MPTDFVFEEKDDFLEAAKQVWPKYITIDGVQVRAFFKGGWWLCVYEVSAKDEKDARAIKDEFKARGFTGISIRESPIRIF